MFGISPQELLLILVVALIVVGPRRLPELGRSLGKGLREIRKAQDEVRRTVQVSLDEEPVPSRATRGQGPPPEEPDGGEAPAAAGPGTAGDSVSEISRTLGRGLGELRRARDEVERSFRVDLNQTPASGAPQAPPPAAEEPGDAEPASEGRPDERRPE